MMHRVVHSRLVLAVLTGADRFLLVKGQSAVRVPTQRLDVFLVPQLVLTLHPIIVCLLACWSEEACLHPDRLLHADHASRRYRLTFIFEQGL